MIIKKQNRRAFLQTASGLMVAGPFISRVQRPKATASKFDPNFGTASQAAKAIRSGAISVHELTEHTYQRIRKYNPRINAFVTLLEEQAMLRAKQADEALAAGQTWGPLHGVPILINDALTELAPSHEAVL